MSTENNKRPYRSCYDLEAKIHFRYRGIVFCCDRPSPATVQPTADAGKTVDDFLETRNRVIRENQGMNPPCEGCVRLQEYEPTNEGKIDCINFGIYTYCNFSCTYCTLQGTEAQQKNKPEPYDSLEIAEELKRRGLLSKNLKIFCDPGEISIHPNRNKYYDFIEENAAAVSFVTNAGRFDPRLAHILNSSPLNYMVVSIDCGTEETFRQIRGVDMFKQVIANLAEYRKYSTQIFLKYILLEENCDDEDLNGFIQIASDLKVPQIVIAADSRKSPFNERSRLSYEEHIVSAAVKLAEGAIKSNIPFVLRPLLGLANLREIYRRLAALPEVVSAEQQLDTILSASKVICYGAGGNCENILDQVEELGLRKPDVIWDIKAEPDQKLCVAGCEYPVCQPDFNSLDNSMETGVFITITSNETNQKLAQNMKEHEFSNLLTHDRLHLALLAKRAKMPIQIRSDK